MRSGRIRWCDHSSKSRSNGLSVIRSNRSSAIQSKFLVVIAFGTHPFPFRTRPLSRPRRWYCGYSHGRVGRRQDPNTEARPRGRASFDSGPDRRCGRGGRCAMGIGAGAAGDRCSRCALRPSPCRRMRRGDAPNEARRAGCAVLDTEVRRGVCDGHRVGVRGVGMGARGSVPRSSLDAVARCASGARAQEPRGHGGECAGRPVSCAGA